MKTIMQELLETVAERNSRLYFDSELYFWRYMNAIGWEDEEVEKMIKHIKRKQIQK